MSVDGDFDGKYESYKWLMHEFFDDSFSVNIDCNDNWSILNESLKGPQLVLDDHSYPDFGLLSTNKFKTQDFTLFREENCEFGGLRGWCWRSRYWMDLSENKNACNIEITEFMMALTKFRIPVNVMNYCITCLGK